ncbi:MAG TPA: hypothetical protein VFP61_11970 [Acidimicrobiales bacterium]|nr:hypothetical protein [Acidimicrobiales bacterium]
MTHRRVDELEPGDRTLDYGTVAHREGRKVWFDDRIVTFPSPSDEVGVEETAEGRLRR